MGVSPPCGRGPAITSRRVVGCRPPTPPVTTLILGPAKPPEIRPFGAEFLRFFGPCGAKSWGGGGAPPTTLILLRNQRLGTPARRHLAHAGTPPGSGGGREGGQGSQRRGGGWPPLGEVGEVGCRWGSAPVAPGGPARPKERGLTPLR